MEYFWTYETDLPAGVGFSHFQGAHLCWLLVLAAMAVTGGILFAKQQYDTQLHIQAVLSITMLLVELVQDCYLKVSGHLDINQLPLHLCGLALFITAARNFSLAALCRKKGDCRQGMGIRRMAVYLGDVQYALCLPGALAALLFPDWTAYPPLSFMSIVGFVNHGLLVTSGLYLCLEKPFSVHIRHIWRPVTFLCLLVPIMYAFDRAYGVNYMFLLWGPVNSPLALLEQKWQEEYLLGYGILVMLVMVVWYLLGMLVVWLRKKFIFLSGCSIIIR